MEKTEWPNQEDEIYYLKINVLKNITPPQIVSSQGHFKNCNNYEPYSGVFSSTN